MTAARRPAQDDDHLTALFAGIGLEVVPRILGLCDRNAELASFGCCDRYYWHYRFLDFPNARFQEAGLLFALAWSEPTAPNPFAGQPRLAAWIRGVWRHWLRQRNSDGSLMEAYPNERSFCATAFSAAAFVETVALMGTNFQDWAIEIKGARNTFLWLGHAENREVANQMAASLQALALYAELTDDDEVHKLAEQRRDAVLSLMESDGTFPEYGGWDAGYQSITLSSLARTLFYTVAPDRGLRAAFEKGVRRLEASILANGRIDPKVNSRATQYVYPSALAYARNPALGRLADGLSLNRILRPGWLDDRYCAAMAIDYLFAARAIRSL